MILSGHFFLMVDFAVALPTLPFLQNSIDSVLGAYLWGEISFGADRLPFLLSHSDFLVVPTNQWLR